MKKNVLFVIANNYFPEDIRVYNESTTLSEEEGYNCYVLTPKKKGEKTKEIVNNITCYRFPYFDAASVIGLVFEYILVSFFIMVLAPVIVFRKKIHVIHLANPPDHLILLVYWLKIFNVKIIFDHHDLAVEVIKGKFQSEKSILLKILVSVFTFFEKISLRLADHVITSNNSIKENDQKIIKKNEIVVVRNSNKIQFNNIEEIPKKKNEVLHLGYFGVIGNDRAAGLDNIILIAKELIKRKVPFIFTVIGDGPGFMTLKELINNEKIEEYFDMRGFVPLNDAIKEIIHFDFGILPWPDIPKNHFLSAIKIINYMCCGVPVCSLKLKEQLITTQGIGIFSDDFNTMADSIIDVYKDEQEYDLMRKRTLERFNKFLCWEIQKMELIHIYNNLFKK